MITLIIVITLSLIKTIVIIMLIITVILAAGLTSLPCREGAAAALQSLLRRQPLSGRPERGSAVCALAPLILTTSFLTLQTGKTISGAWSFLRERPFTSYLRNALTPGAVSGCFSAGFSVAALRDCAFCLCACACSPYCLSWRILSLCLPVWSSVWLSACQSQFCVYASPTLSLQARRLTSLWPGGASPSLAPASSLLAPSPLPDFLSPLRLPAPPPSPEGDPPPPSKSFFIALRPHCCWVFETDVLPVFLCIYYYFLKFYTPSYTSPSIIY